MVASAITMSEPGAAILRSATSKLFSVVSSFPLCDGDPAFMSTDPSTRIDHAARHREAIEALANDTAMPLNEVELVYEAELASLRTWASVNDFVPLFAARRTRDRLRRRR